MLSWTSKYPQNIWSACISKLYKKEIIQPYNENIQWDAPCGNGIISYLLSKTLSKKTFHLLDNDARILDSIYTKVQSSKFQVKQGDIFDVHVSGHFNTWLIINSLYCLPDIDKLIALQSSYFKQIVAVVPDKEMFNFNYFRKKHPDFPNPSLMTVNETIKFFQKMNYTLTYKKDISKIPFHFYGNILDKLRVPPTMKYFIFTLIDKLLFFKRGQYVLMVLSRNE